MSFLAAFAAFEHFAEHFFRTALGVLRDLRGVAVEKFLEDGFVGVEFFVESLVALEFS